MDSNDELKEIDIKNRTCYYFDDIIKIDDLNLNNNLIDENLYENILVYKTSYKNLIAKPLRIRFDTIDGFIRVYDETRYLVLFESKSFDSIYNRIRYLIIVESDITYIDSHNYATIKVDSYDFLPLEKTMTFHNVIIPVISVWKKDKNKYYYYNIFLEKASYEFLKK